MSTRIHIIVSEEEKALFCTAAGDVPLSRWIKKQCLWAAQNQQLDGVGGLREFIATNVRENGPLTQQELAAYAATTIDSTDNPVTTDTGAPLSRETLNQYRRREFTPDPKPTKGKK